MTTMFIRHAVSDYSHWKSAYDGLGSVRKDMGVTAASVHRDATDPNTLVITHQFKDMNAAQAFANSEILKSTMAKAGVIGKPDFWFTEDIENTAV